jgi:hypothetical protein
VTFDRVQTRKIYRIVSPVPPELRVNLEALARCTKSNRTFQMDLSRLKRALRDCRGSRCVTSSSNAKSDESPSAVSV